MYVTGSVPDFLSRLRCLPVSGADLVLYKLEGQTYATGLASGTRGQWNHVFAKSWAQMLPTGASTYYTSGAF